MKATRTCVIGCGLGGISAAIMLAQSDNKIRLFDPDPFILKSLSKGEIPFYDPELGVLLSKGMRGRKITIQDNLAAAMEGCEFVIVAAPTPVLKSGAVNLAPLREAMEDIGGLLEKDSTVVIRSVVPPGTSERELVPILEKESKMRCGKDFCMATFPAFVRPGLSAADSTHPSRIIVGGDTKRTADAVLSLFDSFDCPKVATEIATAEMAKYATSAFLATKISYSNEIANLCERFGIDVKDVLHAVGLDPRIGEDLLAPGVGYGGGCLPKDMAALITAAESLGYRPELLRAVRRVNDYQPNVVVEMLEEELGSLERKRIAVLGLAYKAGVDDVTETKALQISIELLGRGAKVVGYDPLASGAFIRAMPGLEFASSAREALLKADGCVIQTEEEEFKRLGKEDFDLMRSRVVVDGRRILSPTKLSRWGVRLRAVGLGKK